MKHRESVEPEKRLRFIYEDNHLLAADKPSGLPSQPDSSGDASLDVLARDYLRVKYDKPGEVYLGLLHRLDRPTSGVVLMARTGKAATRMADAFRRREVGKTYLALVEARGRPRDAEECADWLSPMKNGSMEARAKRTEGAREARLRYSLAGYDAAGGTALLRIELLTGVKHQIRCQLARRGMPVVGDHRYGVEGRPARPRPVMGGAAILLHAWRADFIHPVRKEPVAVVAALPDYWRAFAAGIDAVGDYFTESQA